MKTHPFRVEDYLDSPEMIAAYAEALAEVECSVAEWECDEATDEQLAAADREYSEGLARVIRGA